MKKISQFPQITDRNGDDWLLIEEAATGAYKRIKVSDFIANLGATTPTVDPVLADNPVAYWKLNESSGSTAIDNGSLALTGAYINGIVGEAASGSLSRCFNTVNNGHVRISDNNAIRFSNAFTIEFWLQLNNTSQTDTYLISKGNDYAILYGFENQTIELYSTNSTVRSGTQIAVNNTNWNHIVYIYNGSALIGYLNGSQVFSVAKSFTLPVSTNNYFTIGATYFGTTTNVANQSNAKFAKVALFNQALSAARIQAHYQSVSLT